MSCVEKLERKPAPDEKNKSSGENSQHPRANIFNDSQRLMVNQFVGFYNALIRTELDCPSGSELLINILQTQIYSSMPMENILQKTGIAHDELVKWISCFEDKGIIVCNDNEIKFTADGLKKVNDISDRTLKMFKSFADKINSEVHFPD